MCGKGFISRRRQKRRADTCGFKVPGLEIVADSEEAGRICWSSPSRSTTTAGLFPRRVYILNNPEYETDTLSVEYHRDRGNDPDYPLPRHYFPGDDPSRAAPNLWRHTAHIYTNWVKADAVLHRGHSESIEDRRGRSGPQRRVRRIVGAVLDHRRAGDDSCPVGFVWQVVSVTSIGHTSDPQRRRFPLGPFCFDPAQHLDARCAGKGSPQFDLGER
jgi:Homoserine O-succinyltransferase